MSGLIIPVDKIIIVQCKQDQSKGKDFCVRSWKIPALGVVPLIPMRVENQMRSDWRGDTRGDPGDVLVPCVQNWMERPMTQECRVQPPKKHWCMLGAF